MAQHSESITGGLSSILKFPTISGGATSADAGETDNYPRAVENCMNFLREEAEKMGLSWRNHANRVAVIQFGPDDMPFVGLPVHIDVVPPGDGWTHDPFGGVVENGAIWGRGSQDNKCAVIQMLWALATLKAINKPLVRGARIIAGTSEETGDWSDLDLYHNAEPQPEMSIVPDALFPIIVGEKGVMNVRMVAELPGDTGGFAGEYRFARASAGERANIVPCNAQLCFAGAPSLDPAPLENELKRFLDRNAGASALFSRNPDNGEVIITFAGKNAHGSMPEAGHNAALDLLLFMTQSGFVSDDEADVAQFLYDCGNDFSGDRLGIASTHPFIGPTTVNLGILKWRAGEQADVIFNIRNTMGLAYDDALRHINDAVEEFSDETGFDMTARSESKMYNAIYTDPQEHTEFIDALKEAWSAFTGREAALAAIGSTTYAKAFPDAVNFGPLDPEEAPELAHMANEHVTIDHHLRNVKIYAYALTKLCTQS